MAKGLPFVMNGLVYHADMQELGLPPNFLTHLAIDYLCCRWLVGLPDVTSTHLRLIDAISNRVRSNICRVWEIVHETPKEFGIKIHKTQHLTELYIPQITL